MKTSKNNISNNSSSKKRKEITEQQNNENKKVKIINNEPVTSKQNTEFTINNKDINDLLSVLNTSSNNINGNSSNTSVNVSTWDGVSPIENLTVGELISSLNGRQHQLRIIVAEYMNSLNRLIGFTEKTPYLLNWVLDNLSKSFINWKQPEKADQLVQKGLEPLCFEERYWELLKTLVNKQIILQEQKKDQQEHEKKQDEQNNTEVSNSSTSTAASSVKLSNDYLQFIFEIILNSIRNIDPKLNSCINDGTELATTSATSKKKKNINIAYQVTTSPPPPIKLLESSKTIIKQFIKIYSSDELMKEIPVFLENSIPLFIKYIRGLEMKDKQEQNQTIESILDLFNTLFQYLLVQIKLGIHYKLIFSTVLSSLLPHILTLENTLFNIQSLFPFKTVIRELSEAILEFIKWSLYHPESHWDSYPYFLFSDWLKKINKEDKKDTVSKDSKSKTKSKEEKQPSKKEEKEKEKESDTMFQPQLILERLSQLINNEVSGNNSKIICYKSNENISLIVLNSLDKFLNSFIESYNSYGYRHFKDINQWYEGNHKDEKFIEFAYFRRLFNLFTPNLLSNNPVYYESASKLLDQISILNIFHISNRYQVDYLSNSIAKPYYSFLSNKSTLSKGKKQPEEQPNEVLIGGVYKCLTSLVKVSNTIISSKLKDVILPNIWSSPETAKEEPRSELLISIFDSYFEIRQIDTLLTLLFQSLINSQIRTFNKKSLSNKFIAHLKKLFANLPFGQVPIIWNLFLEEWKSYYVTQLNEFDPEFADPTFSNRLENFIKLWSTFLDSISISSFVYKMILQLLPNTYQSIVDPILNEISKKNNPDGVKGENLLLLLNLYSSFLQVHSFIHRQTIVDKSSKLNGENDYGYHPQQFYYYKLCEEELEFSKVIEFISNQYLGSEDFTTRAIVSKILIQRVQQLHSILSSVSITHYKRKSSLSQSSPNSMFQSSDGKIKSISSLDSDQFTPKDIESELFEIIYYLLNSFIKLVSNNDLLFTTYNQEGESNTNLSLAIIQSKLLINNISTWCEYSTVENIQNILKFIISPPQVIKTIDTPQSSTNNNISVYSLFQNLLSNPLFFELKIFQHNFPIVLCQMERDIITKELIKSNKLFEKVTEIFNDVQDRLVNSTLLTPSNTSYAEIITEIQDCFSKKISVKDFNISDPNKWERLTWLVSMAPSFHPLYIPIELIGPLVLSSIAINHISVILLKQPDGTISNNNNSLDYIYRLILSSRRFIKFCFEKDQSRLVQIIPMNIWIDLIFSSRMFEPVDIKYPILFTSLEIQNHYDNELWKHSPMELIKLTDKIMNRKTPIMESPTQNSNKNITNSDISTIKPYLIAGILKSISQSTANSGVSSKQSADFLPPDLQSIIKNVEPDINSFFEKMFKSCVDNPTPQVIVPFLTQYQAEFSLLVYHLWYQLQFNQTDSESLSKLLITVSLAGVFISSLDQETIHQHSLIIQNAIISLLDLFSRWHSKLLSTGSRDKQLVISAESLVMDSIHVLSLLIKMLSFYPEDSKLHKSIATVIIQFFQLDNHLGNLLNSIIILMKSDIEKIQYHSFNLLNYFIVSIIGTKRINLLKNPIKVITPIVNIINQANSEPLIVLGLNLLSKIMSINTIDLNGDSIPLILSSMSNFSSPFIYSIPTKPIHSFHTEPISNYPMTLFVKEDGANNFNKGLKPNIITVSILNSVYRLLYIILKYRNNELSKYISSFVSCLRFLLYSISNESNKSLINNDKSVKKVGRLLEVFSANKNHELYFQYLVIDYIQLVRYSTTAINTTTATTSSNLGNSIINSLSNKKQFVGPNYHLSVEMRNLLLPGIFSLIEKSDSNSKNELFQSLEDTGRGIFQNIISQYQSYKYTGK
ncbi:hypothetical protein DICPUDRAFT_81047 [Dictyostelium purpureum]|uniref:Nucleolar 27S pre-rRNA processing Urb2/Npa2 C-terminal domain-containing protein n=1 Tax=Dictyostelium purpureum TaxID=5786 RepID=F0ZSB5_DICPU|nr:uncharacterized protein DICPUDRAFT_81047 [Dictyostelium purpureum]EGC33151.1 hypothetical protein DICPUDRAFT_81047 [Dictyostelium purpureum]|eukprot:XP_003290307.1 hypothetical protein DICPUDRAFT_81047 [Dictyostelium purpureum]